MPAYPQKSSSRPKAAHFAAEAERPPYLSWSLSVLLLSFRSAAEESAFHPVANADQVSKRPNLADHPKTRARRLTGHGTHSIRLHRTVRHIRSRNGVYVSLYHASSPQRADHGPQGPPSDQQRRRHSSRHPGERAQRPSRQLLTPPLATAAHTTKRLQLTPTPKAQDICSRKRASTWYPQRSIQCRDQAPVHLSPYDFYLTCTTSPTNISAKVQPSHAHEENLR